MSQDPHEPQPYTPPSTEPAAESQADPSVPATAEPANLEQALVEKLQEPEAHDNHEDLRELLEKHARYGPLLRDVGATVIGALYVPAILTFLIFQLSPAYDQSALPGAFQRGATSIVIPLLLAWLLARSVKREGLARRQLHWHPLLCQGFYTALVALVIWVLPLRWIYVGLETYEEGAWNDSLGRLAFILSMLGWSAVLFIATQKIWQSLDEIKLFQAWKNWFDGAMLWPTWLAPAALAVMAAMGYYFTAEELSARLIAWLMLVIGIAILAGLSSRLLLITQFGIKLRELEMLNDPDTDPEEAIDMAAITVQVNRLIRATALVIVVVAGWNLWSSVAPNFHLLDQIKLVQLSDGTADGVPAEWLTLSHVLLAGGLLTITYVLSTNLPGLLEITILDRLPLDRGGRYAISFVVRYLVAVIGIVLASQMIGFSWSRVQWLAAGLTVGLGFGLQEIFANLVSGIIILIERPVRVGDLVTVNGTTGNVTKMALRATTVLDFDYRELIVPNKTFITGDVINWTLTDSRSRVIVRVGVAYGSDTDLVQKTLLKVAQRSPFVTSDPPPLAVFAGFGNSTLDFELRVVVEDRINMIRTSHELHMAVDEAFRSKGIEIAFPQQDITIKNLSELPRPLPPSQGTDPPQREFRDPTGRAKPTGTNKDGQTEWSLEQTDSEGDSKRRAG